MASPGHDGEEKALRALRCQVFHGPAVEQVEVFWCSERDPEGSANFWVCDDGWPGCQVVERTVTKGRQLVELFVDRGRELS